MAYPKALYLRAQRILEKRREQAEAEATYRAEAIKKELPEIAAIQQKLSDIGLEISQLFFYKGDIDEKVQELSERSKALVAKRNVILTANGFDENAMKPVYTCAACEDKGFIGGRMCACHKQVLKELMKNDVCRFAPLDACTFDNFRLEYYSDEPLENSVVPRLRAEKALEAARRYAQNFSLNSKNLLFLGATGLGKTHLSLAIANVVIQRGFSVCYGTSYNICEDLRAEAYGKDKRIAYTEDTVFESDLLILDDLGTEIYNQYNTAAIHNIINTRVLSGKPTIISTNYDWDELLDKYDQRVTSRINGEYTQIHLFGNDIRNMK